MNATEKHADGQVPDRGPAVFTVTTITLVLASVFVGARIICRRFVVHNMTWDDKVMILAWLIAFFLSFTINLGVSNGLGRYDAHIREQEWPILRRCEYVFSILYNPALMATKTSILIFYLRLAKNTQVILRYASWATLAVVNVAGIVLTFMNIFQCKPIEAAWKVDFDGRASCIPLLTEFICAAPVNIVTDLAILALPIPVLTGMRLPSRQKTILVLTFALGIFVTIVDVVRIYYLQWAISQASTGYSEDPRSRFGGQPDFSWNASLSLMWSAVEVNIGITSACIPTLKPLVRKLLPAMLHESAVSRTGNSSKSPANSEKPLSRDRSGDATGDAALAVLASNRSYEARVGDERVTTADLDFLTTPDMVSPANEGPVSGPELGGSTSSGPLTHARTNLTTSTAIPSDHGIFFGFVNMSKPKSMLKANASESFRYCTVVSILFFLWGLSYGLLDTLNTAVAAVNNMTAAETLGLTSVYFGGGYFFGPLLGAWILRRAEVSRSRRHEKKSETDRVGGFKVTFISGLCIYGVGTIIFWPSAVTDSYGGFMLSNFIVGFGLAVLEVGANSFLVLCGPADYGATRLLLAQGVQGVGSVLSSLVAHKVFFENIDADDRPANSMTLINVQWTYLGITLLCVILGLFFYYMPLPEVGDDELEELANSLPVNPKRKSVGGLQLRTVCLTLAVVAQYLYVGGQESNSTFFRRLLLSILPYHARGGEGAANVAAEAGDRHDRDKPPGVDISIPDYLLLGHAAFAVSRFLVGYLAYLSVTRRRFPQPRALLTISIVSCFVFSLLPVVLSPPDPDLLVVPVMLFFFFEGPIWPLIFALGLRGQGRRTKRAAAYITMGGSGAGFFPFVLYGIITTGGTVQNAFILIVALQAAMIIYPAFLFFSRDAKKLVDPRARSRQGSRDEETLADEFGNEDEQRGRGGEENEEAAVVEERQDGQGEEEEGGQGDGGEAGSSRSDVAPDNGGTTTKKGGRFSLDKMPKLWGAAQLFPMRKSSQQAEVEHREGGSGSRSG